MSILKVNKLTGIIEAPYGIKSKGGSVTVNFTVDSIGGLPDSSTAQVGDWFWDSGNEILKYYIGPGHSDSDGWINIGLTDSAGASAGSGGFYLETATRGIFTGGFQTNTGNTNFIDYVTIASPGNATDFGDLTVARYLMPSISDNTYGVTGGGTDNSVAVNVIDYVTIASPGNATDFGDLLAANQGPAGAGDGTYGVFAGGQTSGSGSSRINVIQYITVASPGNATDFGDIIRLTSYWGGLCDGIRALFFGGLGTGYVTDIAYVTVQTEGNAADFGDLTVARRGIGPAANGTTGVFGGGGTNTTFNTIDYVTIATPGNATDFGDVTQHRSSLGGCSGT